MSVDTSTNPAQLYKKNRITAAVKAGTGVTLDGRVLNIALAVDRERATTLLEKNKEKAKEDKRNLYLANEGNIRADSEAAKTIPPAELEKREKAFREKKKKLKVGGPTLWHRKQLSIDMCRGSACACACACVCMRVRIFCACE